MSASPKRQSVWEQSFLQAFTHLILFENKDAKGERKRESTEIKCKRNWKLNPYFTPCFWPDRQEELFSLMEELEYQKVHQKTVLIFMQSFFFFCFISLQFLFLTSPSKITFRPQVMLLCTVIGKKSWLMDLAVKVTELWKRGIFIDRPAREFVKK